MKVENGQIAVIIGAGPAGLTAAYELLTRTNITVVVLEKTNQIGGISRTVNYKGNRIDIGGHRFFSKSARVMNWWQMFMPVENKVGTDAGKHLTDNTMLIRNRLSRIFFLRTFFDYPIKLSYNMLKKLGLVRVIKIGYSYAIIKCFPIKKERNLEDFFTNRFGKELYLTFFKDYTKKVWGVQCDQIKPEWGGQRIKGLSVSKAILHALKSNNIKSASIDQQNVETSLIEKFMYPKLGPGQLWEEVAKKITEKGGTILFNQDVNCVNWLTNDQVEVSGIDSITGEPNKYIGNYLFSTMPIKDLIQSMANVANSEVMRIAGGLAYRDFMTVGLLLKKLKLKNTSKSHLKTELIPDNWIYIQEKDVIMGRLQIFNNWSPYLVAKEGNVWIGLEYFCNEGDKYWVMKDEEFIAFATKELVKLEIIDHNDVLDATIIRVPKAYPAYFGTYDKLTQVQEFTDSFRNMFLIGRNGMHKYNNQDHSMLTAMTAVDHIIEGNFDKSKIWEINTEKEHHESTRH